MERRIAYEILCDVLLNDQYASLSLKRELRRVPLEKRGFITELVNGVLRHYYYLEYQFADEIKKGTKKSLKIILAMALYERFFLHKQNYVANEYIKLIDSKNDRGFINAVLRKKDELKDPDMATDEGSATFYSLPLWLYKLLKAQYDKEMFAFILEDLSSVPRVFYRLNHHKASYDDLKDHDITIIDDDVFVSKRSLVEDELFKKGYFYIQDHNSSKIVKELALKEDDIFLDLCSAPGSKLFNALDVVKVDNAYVNDINPKRMKLIEDKAKILGFDRLRTYTEDAAQFDPKLIAKADKILIDVPCSGLGVIKRKPEIRYRLKGEDIDDLVKIQSAILDHVLAHMKRGAILLYSTCTLNTKENERQIKKALSRHQGVDLVDEKLYLDDPNADRFYSAKLLKTF